MPPESAVSLAAHMRLALEASEDAVAWTDLQGRVRWCNARLAAAARRDQGELLQRPLADLLPLSPVGGAAESVHPVTAVLEGRPVPAPCYRLLVDGRETFWEVAGSRLSPPGEAPLAVFWLHDVTRRRAERREANRVAALHAVTREGAVCLDFDGRVTHWNAAAERIYGFAAREVLGRRADSFIPPEGRGRFEDVLERLRRGSGPFTMEAVHSRKDGMRIRVWETVAGFPDEDGRLGGVAVVVRDVTEQRRMEALVQRQVEELRASNRDLDRFAAAASHDLLEPLRKISAYSGLLERVAASALEPEARGILDRIQASAVRMASLIEQMLNYSRLRGQALPPERVELRHAVEGALAELDARVEQSRAVVEIGELPAVLAHPFQLRQLFCNLLSNALKFAKPGRLPHLRVTARPAANGFVEVLVSDDGVGFDARHSDKVFEPFVRLHGRGEYEGHGLGLPICRNIAERHGGSIRAESEPGKGATFIVTLPLADETDGAAAGGSHD